MDQVKQAQQYQDTMRVSVSNVQNILKEQGADWNQAALALAKIVAGDL